MKPDYKNWIPNGMLLSFAAGAVICLTGFVLFGALSFKTQGIWRWAAAFGFGIPALLCIGFFLWGIYAYRAFSYEGKQQISRRIVEGTARYINLPEGGIGLDVGCGSGALCIACAKRNPHARMLGIDRWGLDYASFSQKLCEENARAEGVTNTEFIRGNAVKLDFPDETFDAVTSNYVYHNIIGANKQALLRETLRVLKKGGTFAIHDLMSHSCYGDMEKFLEKLRENGYEKAELIDTTQNLFMSPQEARKLLLPSSTLLVGKK